MKNSYLTIFLVLGLVAFMAPDAIGQDTSNWESYKSSVEKMPAAIKVQIENNFDSFSSVALVVLANFEKDRTAAKNFKEAEAGWQAVMDWCKDNLTPQDFTTLKNTMPNLSDSKG